jgi:hypothetical protein
MPPITLTTPMTTYAEINELREFLVGGVCVQKSRYGDGITFGFFCSLVFSSHFFSSLDLSPVQMSLARVFYNLPLEEKEFPHSPDLPKGHHEPF